MRKSIAEQFDPLTREQILAIRPGVWGDVELLDALGHFEKAKERDRAMAVAELILRSPQVEQVDYHWLYTDLIGYYHWKCDFPAALRWAHALIAFDEQHEEGRNRANNCRELARVYLNAGDLDTGLALFTRLAQAAPFDIWTYNILSIALPWARLPRLGLEVTDYTLMLIAKKDPEDLKQQLTVQRQCLAETVASVRDRTSDLDPSVLAEFRAALLPPKLAKAARSTRRKYTMPYLPPVAHLLNADSAGEAALGAEIMARGRVLVPELVRLAFDFELPADGAPARAIALLRAMLDAQTAELGELSAWLDQASGDWRGELQAQRCGKVGGYVTPELEAIAADVEYSVFVRESAVESLVERAQRLPALRERVVAFMRLLLTRPESAAAGEEMFMGFLIGDVLDLGACELYPEIRRAFEDDRVDTSIVDLSYVHDRFGLATVPIPRRRQDGMYLRLRCTACEREREHFVQNILLDIPTLDQQMQGQPVAYDPYIMDHEIVCPKCGAVDRYAMTPQAFLSITVLPNKLDDLTALLSGEKSADDLPPNPRIHPFKSLVFDKPMHPLVGLEEYRRRIAANPKDARLHLKMGNLLLMLYRSAEALEAHRQAYALDPNDAEIALARGMSEHDYGDQAAAKEMYERVLALEKGGRLWGFVRVNEWSGAAFEGLDLLKRRKPSPSSTPFRASDQKAQTSASAPAARPRKQFKKRRK